MLTKKEEIRQSNKPDSNLDSTDLSHSEGIRLMEMSELLMLIGLLVPGILLSVLIMVAFAAGG
jgi:hypothetical protein